MFLRLNLQFDCVRGRCAESEIGDDLTFGRRRPLRDVGYRIDLLPSSDLCRSFWKLKECALRETVSREWVDRGAQSADVISSRN